MKSEKTTALGDRILAFMREEAYRPLLAEDLAEQIELKGKELGEFWSVLDELEAKALIVKTRYDKYGLPEKMNLLVGRFAASAKGFGFVIDETHPDGDLYIPSNGVQSAMHNDKVIARVHHHVPGTGRRREGEIIRIIERANTKIVGTFESSRHYGFVIPDDPRIGTDIFIPKGEFNGAKKGAKVVIAIVKWPEKRKSAEGKVLEVLGYKGDPGLEILSAITRHNLALKFPPAVEQDSSRIPDTIGDQELLGRRDLRHLPIVTIDGEDAKDLDDAVHIERLPGGLYRLGVHIADVSYYVKENTPLDKEARERGTSVYLVDRVLPMLPPRLSNGICSLTAGVDRLTLSAQMDIDHRGQVVAYEIFPSVIHVHERLTYTAVRKMLVDNDADLHDRYSHLVPHLEHMERLCRILKERRLRRGAIDFDFPEIKVKLDDEGRPVELVKRVRSIAESIIEEFMLVANETVAEHMHRIGVPSMFRVHDEPDSEKMEKLNHLLHTFGQTINKVDDVHPMVLQKILAKIAGRPEERIISTVMLRSLKQARYEAENRGHFGLAARYYTHFTSPIRRYPDLVLHRLLRETFTSGDISAKRRAKLALLLPKIALHASERERAAAEAERETVDLKKVEYMARFIGDEFDGIISGVTSFGLFVELDNGVEGLIHVSSMDDDFYHYREEDYGLWGERTGKVFRLGDIIKVRVAKVNAEERTIDLTFATDFDVLPRGRRKKMPPSAAKPPKPGRSKKKK